MKNPKHTSMLKTIWLVAIVFSVCILLVVGSLLNQYIKRINNRKNLEEIVSTRLPQLPGFEVINVMSEDFESSLDTNSCFYSRNYYSMGSSLPEDIAVATYRQGLEDMGWQNWIVADSFRYGESAQVSNSPWRISNVFLRPLVTDEVVPKYQSIIVITVSYLFC